MMNMDMEDRNKAMEVVMLDDKKKYVIVEKISYQNHDYIYLAEIGNVKNYIIGEITNDIITDVEDKELLKELILKFNSKLGMES